MASTTKFTLSTGAYIDIGASPCKIVLMTGAGAKLHYGSVAPGTADGSEAWIPLLNNGADIDDPRKRSDLATVTFTFETGRVFAAAISSPDGPDFGSAVSVLVIRN